MKGAVVHRGSSALAFCLLAMGLLAAMAAAGRQAIPPQDSSASSRTALTDIVEAGYLPDLFRPGFGDFRPYLVSFYEPAGYSLAWVKDGQPTHQALKAIEAFQNAAIKGLDADDYDGPRWAGRITRLQQCARAQATTDSARFDVALTVCLMRLLSDLHMGRVSPQRLHPGLNIGERRFDPARLMRERFVDARDIGAAIESVEPPFPDYHRTQRALVKYLRLAREDDGTQLPVRQNPVRKGDIYSGVPQLVRRLKLLGDLPTSSRIPANATIYDTRLAEAVTRFQRRHGLTADGRLGRATIEQLNTPLSQRVEQLRLALERWRWVPRDPARALILVNLPEFRLQAWADDGAPALAMKVVVGRAYENETPIVAAEMNHLIFRPAWSVPPRIQSTELVPKAQRDRSYLARNGYQIVDSSGKMVSSGPVDDETLKRLRRGGLSIRQTPGPHNSLGLIKFVFPNRYDVYLHGTPARDLLSMARRDFSHGCIRVEDPARLAAWVLGENPEWNEKRIRAAMRGRRTFQVNVNDRILVMVFYATAVVLETDEVRFFPDLYGHDAALQHALATRQP